MKQIVGRTRVFEAQTTKNIVIPFRWDVILLQATRSQLILVKPIIRQFIVASGKGAAFCPMRTKRKDPVQSLALNVDSFFVCHFPQ